MPEVQNMRNTSEGKKYHFLVSTHDLRSMLKEYADMEAVMSTPVETMTVPRKRFPAGTVITSRLLDRLESAGLDYVPIMDAAGFSGRTSNTPTRQGVPLVNLEAGLDETRLRDAFADLSADLVATGEFSVEAVGDTMHQMTLLLENLVRFGGVMREMQSLLDHSEYTYRHSLDAMFISVLLAKKLEEDGVIEKLTPERMLTLATGAFFHDIGKLNVPKHIVDKPGPLTNEEFDQMKNHTRSGLLVKLLASKLGKHIGCIDMDVVSAMCQGHHNRHDDKGYSSEAFKAMPESLRKHEFVEVLTIADAVDAMLKKRQYKDEMHPTDVASQLVNGRGAQFKPEYVDRMLDILVKYPENSLVVLQDGSFGVVESVKTEGTAASRTMRVSLVGSFTRSGEGVAGGTAECFEADVAVGACRLDQLGKRVAEYISKNPDTELSRTLFEETGKNLVRVSENMSDTDLVARLVDFIVDSTPIAKEVDSIMERVKESKKFYAHEEVSNLMDRVDHIISTGGGGNRETDRLRI